jgi:cysteine desulfurase/selenocysteine lyase
MNTQSKGLFAEIRSDFPLLQRRVDGRPLVYLDSAATSLKPDAVIRAERAYSEEYTANIHRGIHLLSEEASAAYEAARHRTARFLKADPSSVVFVKNATEGLNLVARGIGLTKSDRVLTSLAEHHSNLLPWMREATMRFVERDPLLPLDPAKVLQAVETHRPRVLALSHASNVTGIIEPIAEICQALRGREVLVVVDASQSAPHLPLDVVGLGCDFLAFSGHKMLGPPGTGVLWGRKDLLEGLAPLVLGGGAVTVVSGSHYELKPIPYRFEAGTPNIAGVIGLAAAMDFLDRVGFESIAAYEEMLAAKMETELSNVPGTRLIMSTQRRRLALAEVVLTSSRLGPDEVALMLSDTFKIMVRSGFHCAHPLFEQLGLTRGAVRASAYLYNTEDDISELANALRSILK